MLRYLKWLRPTVPALKHDKLSTQVRRRTHTYTHKHTHIRTVLLTNHCFFAVNSNNVSFLFVSSLYPFAFHFLTHAKHFLLNLVQISYLPLSPPQHLFKPQFIVMVQPGKGLTSCITMCLLTAASLWLVSLATHPALTSQRIRIMTVSGLPLVTGLPHFLVRYWGCNLLTCGTNWIATSDICVYHPKH